MFSYGYFALHHVHDDHYYDDHDHPYHHHCWYQFLGIIEILYHTKSGPPSLKIGQVMAILIFIIMFIIIIIMIIMIIIISIFISKILWLLFRSITMQNLDFLAWKLSEFWQFWSSSSLWASSSSLKSSLLVSTFWHYLDLLPCKIWTSYLKNCPSYGLSDLHHHHHYDDDHHHYHNHHYHYHHYHPSGII